MHTHSFWSDGDDFPESIVDWYKNKGYHFLGISDHNGVQEGQRWMPVTGNETRKMALEKYKKRFGTSWVEERSNGTNSEVRLKPLAEYRTLFEEPGKFLMIPSEELTDSYKKLPIHMNASNIRDFIQPQGGNSVQDVMQRNVNEVLKQRERTKQDMIPHLNHPNFWWGVTAEDLAGVKGERFFEVYNGHPQVHNAGDKDHPDTDRIWDIALSLRLTSDNPEPLYALGVDDSHHYHKFGLHMSNSGRGWIMVRAEHLTPESIIRSMERGDFYASSGVVLKEVNRETNRLSLEIEAENGVTYRTQFIGTRKGFNSASEPVVDKEGNLLPITRKYSEEVGAVLAEETGPKASYTLKGDELYVRAKIISSRKKENPSEEGEFETAWTQPVFGAHQ